MGAGGAEPGAHGAVGAGNAPAPRGAEGAVRARKMAAEVKPCWNMGCSVFPLSGAVHAYGARRSATNVGWVFNGERRENR